MLCGCREQFGDGSALMALPKNRFVYVVETNLERNSRDDVASWIDEAITRWRDADIDIGGERIGHINDAKQDDIVLRIISKDLGGDGVIADQELPSRGKRIYQMRWNTRLTFVATDRSMRSGTIDPLRSGTHELGHFWGSHHFPVGSPDELMEPRITQHIIAPQPTETKLVQGWFGRRPQQPGTPSAPTTGELIIRCRGHVDGIEIPGYRITKLA